MAAGLLTRILPPKHHPTQTGRSCSAGASRRAPSCSSGRATRWSAGAAGSCLASLPPSSCGAARGSIGLLLVTVVSAAGAAAPVWPLCRHPRVVRRVGMLVSCCSMRAGLAGGPRATPAAQHLGESPLAAAGARLATRRPTHPRTRPHPTPQGGGVGPAAERGAVQLPAAAHHRGRDGGQLLLRAPHLVQVRGQGACCRAQTRLGRPAGGQCVTLTARVSCLPGCCSPSVTRPHPHLPTRSRYLCPVGGMNGLFAKLSMTELRARQGVCSGTCGTYHCYKVRRGARS